VTAPNPASRRFSIIIVHRNGATMLLKALTALYAACDAARDEVFVVDNGSSDDSPAQAAAAFPDVQLIRNPCNAGFARANNQAIERARGEFVVLLNNDAFLAPDALDRFEAVFRSDARCAVVAGQLLDADGRPQRSAKRIPTALDELGLGFLRRAPRAPSPQALAEVEGVVGACMAVRSTAIREAGSLDDDFFFYYEETEWCHRLRAHGWRVLLEPAARITHLKGASTRGKRRGAQIEMLRSRLIFYRKTMPAPLALLLTANRVLRVLLNAATNLAAATLTLGLHRGLRDQCAVRLAQLGWLMLGCPWNWGLPEKCPRDRTGNAA
jgi:N-acetylglucosaminyl-diphospho-decaprenol L-rhamnosyltransferase